jgi:flagellar assembly protein FliH
MGASAKFLFDVDFSSGADRKPTEPVLSLAEHAAKVAEAETTAEIRGFSEGQAAAKAESDRRMADALEGIAANLAEAAKALASIETRLECEAVEVAVAVARKLAPALIAREPFAEISTLTSDCFRELVAAPHIAVRVNEAQYAVAKERLDDIARAKSFEGRLVVLAEPEVAAGDCRIEWADGGVRRDSAAADAVISGAVAAYVSARRNFADAKEAGQ